MLVKTKKYITYLLIYGQAPLCLGWNIMPLSSGRTGNDHHWCVFKNLLLMLSWLLTKLTREGLKYKFPIGGFKKCLVLHLASNDTRYLRNGLNISWRRIFLLRFFPSLAGHNWRFFKFLGNLWRDPSWKIIKIGEKWRKFLFCLKGGAGSLDMVESLFFNRIPSG